MCYSHSTDLNTHTAGQYSSQHGYHHHDYPAVKPKPGAKFGNESQTDSGLADDDVYTPDTTGSLDTEQQRYSNVPSPFNVSEMSTGMCSPSVPPLNRKTAASPPDWAQTKRFQNTLRGKKKRSKSLSDFEIEKELSLQSLTSHSGRSSTLPVEETKEHDTESLVMTNMGISIWNSKTLESSKKDRQNMKKKLQYCEHT